jgi:response regulator containing a cheY-like receiver domain and an HTH DNA-binding domain
VVSLQPHIAVGIVDDEAFVRSALRVYLSNTEDIEVIGEAAGGTEAISMVENSNPDVLLLDLQMPDLDGVEVTRRLREKGFTTRIVVVTAHVDDQYVPPALLAGASGYIVKDSEPQKIVQSVRDVTRGELVIDPQVIRYLIDAASRSNPAKNMGVSAVTEREKQVLQELCAGSSNSEMASHLFLSESTIKYYLSNLMRKFDSRDRVQLIVSAFRAGLVA